jgi:hypothetical protein
MPSRAVLLSAGRADLVNLVLKVGGFTQVWCERAYMMCEKSHSRCEVSQGLGLKSGAGVLNQGLGFNIRGWGLTSGAGV